MGMVQRISQSSIRQARVSPLWGCPTARPTFQTTTDSFPQRLFLRTQATLSTKLLRTSVRTPQYAFQRFSMTTGLKKVMLTCVKIFMMREIMKERDESVSLRKRKEIETCEEPSAYQSP